MGEIGKTRLDDTPVNGELEKGITSNWAYDEDVTLRALIEASLPWIIQIDPYTGQKSQTNWSTISQTTSQINCATLDSTGAQNAEISWDILIPKGTWSIYITHLKASNRGIYSLQLDSVEIATFDGYADPAETNIIATITPITIPTTKKIELKLKMATKNTGSSSYAGSISSIQLIRTA